MMDYIRQMTTACFFCLYSIKYIRGYYSSEVGYNNILQFYAISESLKWKVFLITFGCKYKYF